MKRLKRLQKGLQRLGDLKFEIHRAKGNWRYVDLDTLLNECEDEFTEFKVEEDFEKRLLELGDIYNYLLMIYDKLLDKKNLAKRKKNKGA